MDSDYGELLAAYSRLERKQKWGTLKMLLVMASTFGGSGFAASQYLHQLATKADVAALIAGQQAELKDIHAQIGILNVRVSVAEERLSGMKVRP